MPLRNLWIASSLLLELAFVLQPRNHEFCKSSFFCFSNFFSNQKKEKKLFYRFVFFLLRRWFGFFNGVTIFTDDEKTCCHWSQRRQQRQQQRRWQRQRQWRQQQLVSEETKKTTLGFPLAVVAASNVVENDAVTFFETVTIKLSPPWNVFIWKRYFLTQLLDFRSGFSKDQWSLCFYIPIEERERDR